MKNGTKRRLDSHEKIVYCYITNKFKGSQLTNNGRYVSIYDDETNTWHQKTYQEIIVPGTFKWISIDEAYDWHESNPWGTKKYPILPSDTEVYKCFCEMDGHDMNYYCNRCNQETPIDNFIICPCRKSKSIEFGIFEDYIFMGDYAYNPRQECMYKIVHVQTPEEYAHFKEKFWSYKKLDS